MRAFSPAWMIVFLSFTLLACGAQVSTTEPPPPPPGVDSLTTYPGIGSAELPRVFLDTRYVAPTGSTIAVRAGEDLQAAIDRAQPGDVIQLEAGATFLGNFTLPQKATPNGSGWITIRTSAPDASLPREGQRITPAYSSVLPKIVSPNRDPAIRTVPGAAASWYRLTGVEVTFAPSAGWNYGIVVFGDGTAAQSSLAQVPHDLIVDRSYLHGQPGLNLTRCAILNSARTAIIDSYLSECHDKFGEPNAIKGWNGPGPFKIVNNYLAGSSINVMFGGVDPPIPDLIPSDIEIRRNHFHKPVAWKGVYSVKNHLELKAAQRVLVEGNVFENHWVDAQDGYPLMFRSANQSGACPWCVVQDVTVRSNRVSNAPAGITVAARPAWPYPALPARRVTIVGNVFDRINTAEFPGNGRLVQTGQDVADLVVEHNTFIAENGGGAIWFATLGPLERFRYANNVTTRGQYGVLGLNSTEGSVSLSEYAPGVTFAGNIVIGGQESLYPTGNLFPATVQDLGFVNPALGVWRLDSRSAYKGTATDGTDPGANIATLEAATRNVTIP
jgi:hypothetical protein